MTQKEEITYSNEDSQDDFSPPACGAADKKSKIKDQDMIANLHFVKELGLKSKEALEKARSAGIAIRVVEFSHDNLVRVARGENIGTLVTPE